ncbi:phage portal protein [Caldifermentibacillus hisashii]|uniref:phage portal protein n=1 Tax=Caldifermentibacillus hisashii TaxID=996558 RepID=UPI0031FC6741
MGLYSFFKSFFTPEGKLSDTIVLDLAVEYHVKCLAVQSSVNLIANTLVRCPIRTYENGKEIFGNNHYLLNVEPNQNQNASQFFHEFVSKLVLDNECLVIMQNEQLYVADSFERKEYAFYENVYKNVVVNDFQLDKQFKESEVLYFELNNKKIKNVIDDLYNSYGKLITAAMNYYKRSNALRVKLKIESSGPQTDEEQANREDMFNSQLKRFLEAEGAAAWPEQDDVTLEELQNLSNSGRTSRDIRALVDDIFDFVSTAFLIPKGLIKGDLADVEGQTDNYIMFCIAPIASQIEDEANRKIYKKDGYLKRNYLRVDTSMIKYTDIVKLATAMDKLISSGTHSANENRMLIGKEPINEDWANEHYITKNYQKAENLFEGGEEV